MSYLSVRLGLASLLLCSLVGLSAASDQAAPASTKGTASRATISSLCNISVDGAAPSVSTVGTVFDGPHGDCRMVSPLDGWAVTMSAVFRTTDGALHWTLVEQLPSPYIRERSYFLDAYHAWIVDGAGLLRTTDGGRTWVRDALPRTVAQQVAAGKVSSMSLGFSDPEHGTLFVLSSGGKTMRFFFTTDGGADWSLPQSPGGPDWAGGSVSVSILAVK